MAINNSCSPHNFFIDCRFDDFDAFTETARAWDLSFHQLERGKFSAELLQCGIGDSQIGKAKFDRKLDQLGAPPAGLRTFVVPANANLDLNWRRHQVSETDLMVFPAGGELSSVSNSCFDVFTISLADEVLEKCAETNENHFALRLLQSSEVFQLPAIAMKRIRESCFSFFDHLAMAPERLHDANFGAELQEELPGLIIAAISHSGIRKSKIPQARVRSQALKRALDAIVAYAEAPLTVMKLCEMTGASERTLQYAFQEKYGISPKAYLQSYRLNQVRKKLRPGNPSNTVISDIANEWGFWHMGQFAADYRRMFGELPSATLSR